MPYMLAVVVHNRRPDTQVVVGLSERMERHGKSKSWWILQWHRLLGESCQADGNAVVSHSLDPSGQVHGPCGHFPIIERVLLATSCSVAVRRLPQNFHGIHSTTPHHSLFSR